MATSLALLALPALPALPALLAPPAGLALLALLVPPALLPPRRPLALLPPRRPLARNFNQSKSKRETPLYGAFFMGGEGCRGKLQRETPSAGFFVGAKG